MALEDIMAEKIRAALMRQALRDYFDLWLLFRCDDVAFEMLPDLVRLKLEAVDHRYDLKRCGRRRMFWSGYGATTWAS